MKLYVGLHALTFKILYEMSFVCALVCMYVCMHVLYMLVGYAI